MSTDLATRAGYSADRSALEAENARRMLCPGACRVPLEVRTVHSMTSQGPFDNILSRDDWLAILRCVGAEQERVDGEMGRLAPAHPHRAATEKAHADLAALRTKLHRLLEELGHAVT